MGELSGIFGDQASLLSLFAGSFLAATVLPGGSEALLFGVLKLHPALFWPAIGLATLGNTLGGMTSFWMGKFIPEGRELKGVEWLRQHGSPLLLLAWAPLVGDALCAAAGWLRMSPWLALVYMGIGKGLRYWAVAAFSF